MHVCPFMHVCVCMHVLLLACARACLYVCLHGMCACVRTYMCVVSGVVAIGAAWLAT